MRRPKFIPFYLSLSLSLLLGCETIVYWEKLPQPSLPRVVMITGDNQEILRAVKITQRLVDAAPFPAATVFVMTLTYFRTKFYQQLPAFDTRARAFRCPLQGEEMDPARAPSSGCIVVPENYLDRLSDEGLAALIAHELGHIERGHKTWQGAAEPVLIQWEADKAAMNRLYLAGYCAGETLRKAAKEFVSEYGYRASHPWQSYPQDCKPKDFKELAAADKAAVSFNRGRTYHSENNYDKAIQEYNEAIRLRADYDLAFYRRAHAYGSNKDNEKAIADFDQAIKLNPNFFEALNDRGNAYSFKGNHDRAIQDYDEAIRLKPDYTLAFYNRGRAYYGKRDYERALADFNRTLQLDPNYAAVFNARGLVYNAKRDYELAIQDYDQAVRLNPKYTAAFNNRGNVYRSLRNYDRAIQDYDEAVRLNPSYALGFNNRATAHREKRDYERSLADYEAAARIDPKVARHKPMGHALFYLGRMEQSADVMERAIQAAPQDIYAMLWRYIALAKVNKIDVAARELSENAAKLIKSSWPAAVIDYYLGRIDEKKMYVAAENFDPKKANEQLCEANFYSAEAKLLKNAQSEAIALLRAAEKDCPSNFYESHGASAELKRLSY